MPSNIQDFASRLPVGQPRQLSLARRIGITLGLSAFGAMAGAVAGGTCVVAGASVMFGAPDSLGNVGFMFLMGAMFGAPAGAVLLPIATWTIMRRVPFGVAFLGTAGATALGGILGWFVVPESVSTNFVVRSIATGALAFGVASSLLGRYYGRRNAPSQGAQES
ncbi:MAG: hypothetical protein ACO1Q7_13685 [Gemmatimonas sp.]